VNKMQLAKAVRDVASDLSLSGTPEQDRIAKAFDYLADLIEAIDEDPAPGTECVSPEREGEFKFSKNDATGNTIVMWNGIKLGELKLSPEQQWIVLGPTHTLTRYKTRSAAGDRLLQLYRRRNQS